ncbi:MAG: hypothetical protein RR247_04095 [Clostridia bacterium]
MLRINGEITNLISDLEFNSKEELMDKLRLLRKLQVNTQNTSASEYYQMLGTAIQQAFYTNPNQIMRYKNYCEFRKNTGGKNAKQINESNN